jgi:transcriptional regulator of aromatic amino acid metabolism
VALATSFRRLLSKQGAPRGTIATLELLRDTGTWMRTYENWVLAAAVEGGHSYRDVADALGISHTTVARRLAEQEET